MRIKDLPESSKPRERFIEKGADALSDAELLALILRTGIKGENVIEMSNRLISEYGLDKLFHCSLEELQKIKGIGKNKAIQILTIGEIKKRLNSLEVKPVRISFAEDVFNYFHDKLKNEKQENFFVLLLDTKNKIIKDILITKGILDSSLIHSREIFNPAIRHSASKIILVHNHPSGDSTPSQEDLEITEKIVKVGEELDIKVLDHVVIGRDNYWSWKEEN